MNDAMKTTAGDLAIFLQKAFANNAVSEHLREAVNSLIGEIVEANTDTHPHLEGTAVQTGPLSWSLSFSAPGLWNAAYGTQSRSERGFETRSIFAAQRRLP